MTEVKFLSPAAKFFKKLKDKKLKALYQEAIDKICEVYLVGYLPWFREKRNNKR